MIPATYTYIALMAGSLFFPLIFSFDKKVHFYRHWGRLLPATIAGAALFAAWDIFFTSRGVWGFNGQYTIGIYFIGLPVEEWAFFFVIPYCCIFIYECIKAYFRDILFPFGKVFALIIFLTSVSALIFYYDRLYTLITFSGLAMMCLVHYTWLRNKYLGRFLMMWTVHLIPLFLINGVLTSLPVVWYNDAENMGLRIGTVPLEDPFYSMLLLMIVVTVYEGISPLYNRQKQVPRPDSMGTLP